MNRLRKQFALLIFFAALPAMALMCLALFGRSLRITDVANAQTLPAGTSHDVIRLSSARTETADLIIPLADAVYPEDIRFENRYMELALYIYIRSQDVSFYHETPVPCREDQVLSVRCSREDGSDTLCLICTFDSVYEAAPEITADEIRIRLTPPADIYTRIIVLDPVRTDDSDISLLLAQEIATLADSSGDDIRIYLTRTTSTSADDASCLRLAHDTSATRYLKIEAFSGGEAAASAYYNGNYFIRGYGNMHFATDVEKSLAATSLFRTDGVFVSTADQTLSALKTPAALLLVSGVDEDNNSLLRETASMLYRSLLQPEEN